MVTLILSALLGVLATKIFDGGKRRKKQTYIYVSVIVFFVLFAVIGKLIKNSPPTSKIYKSISECFDNFEDNIILQCILILIVTMFIFYVDTRDVGNLPFKKYSEKIRAFTKNARENSIIKIAAGDMDFLGGVSLDGVKNGELMDNSLEYQQLFGLQKNLNGLKLKILCSHGLEKEQELFAAIINGTTNPKILLSRYRNADNLDNPTFQQLLRIGRIKTDFKTSVEIRFYNDMNKDKGFRARFVDNSGIVYRQEEQHIKKYLS